MRQFHGLYPDSTIRPESFTVPTYASPADMPPELLREARQAAADGLLQPVERLALLGPLLRSVHHNKQLVSDLHLLARDFKPERGLGVATTAALKLMGAQQARERAGLPPIVPGSPDPLPPGAAPESPAFTVGMNGDYTLKDETTGRTRVIASRDGGAREVTVHDPAELPRIIAEANGYPVYMPHASLDEARQDDLGYPAQAARELEGWRRAYESGRISENQYLAEQEKYRARLRDPAFTSTAVTRLKEQRSAREEHLRTESRRLSDALQRLDADLQVQRLTVLDGPITDQEKNRLLQELHRSAGQSRMALIRERRALLEQARGDFDRGMVSAQEYEAAARTLGLEKALAHPPDDAAADPAWEDDHTLTERLRASPTMGFAADELSRLTANYERSIAALLPAIEGGDEKTRASAQAMMEAYQTNRRAILDAATARQGEMNRAFSGLKAEQKKRLAGLRDAGEFSYHSDEANKQNYEAEMEFQEEEFSELAAKFGLTLEQARALRSDIDAMEEWQTPLLGTPDKARVLSDGRVVVNPRYWVDPQAYESAVASAKASPEAKRQALAMLPELRKAAAKDLLESLATIRDVPEVKAWFDTHPGTPEEQAAALAREQKGSVLDQAINRLNSGGAGIAQQGLGVLAALTGFIRDKTGLSLGDDYLHASMQYWQDRSAAWERLADLGNTGTLANGFTRVLGAGTSILPPLALGGVVQRAGSRILGLTRTAAGTALTAEEAAAAASKLTRIGMLSGSGTAALQSAGSVYGQAYARLRQQGLPEPEARKQALKPAVIGGLITGALTYIGGPTGVESFFKSTAARDLVKQTLGERLKSAGIHYTKEALEEGTDTLLQGITARLTYYGDKPMGEILSEAWDAAWIGGTLGGGISLTQSGAPPVLGRVNPGDPSQAPAPPGGSSPVATQPVGAETQAAGDVAGAASTVGRVAFSNPAHQSQHSQAKSFRAIATEDTFRRGGPVHDTDLNAILQTMASQMDRPETIVVEPNPPLRPDIAKSYVVTINNGGEVIVNIQADGTVWVDTQGVRAGAPAKKVQGGDLIYQAVSTYALNNGLRFAPDPREITPIAERRRISHMISSALRHQTTRHLQPYHASDKYNGALPPQSEWRQEQNEADFEHNLELLIKAELGYVASEMQARGVPLDSLRYDPETDTV